MTSLLTVLELTHHRKQVGCVELLECFVESAGGTKIGELEFTTVTANTLTEDVESASLGNLPRKTCEETFLDVCTMLLLELVPFFGLSRINEVNDIPRN